jgi:hypothetical protein
LGACILTRGGVTRLQFDRHAANLDEALASAIHSVESAGLTVARIESNGMKSRKSREPPARQSTGSRTILFFSIEWLAVGRRVNVLLWVRKVGERWISCDGAKPCQDVTDLVVVVIGLDDKHRPALGRCPTCMREESKDDITALHSIRPAVSASSKARSASVVISSSVHSLSS